MSLCPICVGIACRCSQFTRQCVCTCPRLKFLSLCLPQLWHFDQLRVMPSGVVKKWFDTQGYGFNAPDYGRSDVFVHRHGLLGGTYLTVGQPVVYEVEYSSVKREVARSEDSRDAPRTSTGCFFASSVPRQRWASCTVVVA